ncbi:MAG: YggU family protein [Kiritimatiellales bacterium]|nr:YggU family protein [Kiritimatiellales bacterium]
MEWMNETATGLDLRIKVVPRASKNEIQGLHDGALKIRLTTPPVDGKANQALIKFLSKTLKISKAQIELVQGETSRLKTLRISGITKQQLYTKLDL